MLAIWNAKWRFTLYCIYGKTIQETIKRYLFILFWILQNASKQYSIGNEIEVNVQIAILEILFAMGSVLNQEGAL